MVTDPSREGLAHRNGRGPIEASAFPTLGLQHRAGSEELFLTPPPRDKPVAFKSSSSSLFIECGRQWGTAPIDN